MGAMPFIMASNTPLKKELIGFHAAYNTAAAAAIARRTGRLTVPSTARAGVIRASPTDANFAAAPNASNAGPAARVADKETLDKGMSSSKPAVKVGQRVGPPFKESGQA